MGRRMARACVLILGVLILAAPLSYSADRINRSVAAAEAFVPAALLLFQGTDTPFELAVFGGSVALQTIPNVVMLIGEASGRPGLTRWSRWINFGIDAGLTGGLIGVGIAHFAGAFGQASDVRSLGAYYLALSLPAAIAAFADFFPFSVEARGRLEVNTADAAE